MAFDFGHKPRKERKRAKVRRRATILQAIIVIIREDWREGITPTLLNHEGTLRASLRSGLCLQGLAWVEANGAANEIVTEAFKATGAKRPAWKEGQAEHTDGGVIRDTRLRCAQCERPLPPEHKTFCGKLCFDAHRARRAYHENIEQRRMLDRLRQRSLTNAA